MFKKMAKRHQKNVQKGAMEHFEQKKYLELLQYIRGNGPDRLHPPAYLNVGQALHSTGKNYCLYLESNGSLSIYVSSHFCEKNRIWSTPGGKEGDNYKAFFREDGTFSVCTETNQQIWAAKVKGKNKGPFCLLMQDTGNLVIVDSNGKQHWQSQTDRQ